MPIAISIPGSNFGGFWRRCDYPASTNSISKGSRWRDAPREYDLHKTIINRFIR
jgi:hypothetical protein